MLENLNGVKKIGDFSVIDMSRIKEEKPEMFRPDGSMRYDLFEKEIRPYNFIYVRPDVNSISFTIQNGPIKENGINGCQVDTIIEAVKIMIENVNKKFPCEENSLCVSHLNKALNALDSRKKDREKRGVEGTNKK